MRRSQWSILANENVLAQICEAAIERFCLIPPRYRNTPNMIEDMKLVFTKVNWTLMGHIAALMSDYNTAFDEDKEPVVMSTEDEEFLTQSVKNYGTKILKDDYRRGDTSLVFSYDMAPIRQVYIDCEKIMGLSGNQDCPKCTLNGFSAAEQQIENDENTVTWWADNIIADDLWNLYQQETVRLFFIFSLQGARVKKYTTKPNLRRFTIAKLSKDARRILHVLTFAIAFQFSFCGLLLRR